MMKHLIRNAALALCVVTLPGTWADTSPGVYVSVSAGLNMLGDEALDVTIDGLSGSGEAGFDASFGSGGAIGYRFDNGFSVEGEFHYRRVELDSVSLGTLGTYSEGDFANTQLNINGYYHFERFRNPDFSLYLGAGLAYINEVDTDLENNGVELEFEADDFALELMGGARYEVSERIFLDLGIRYLPAGGLTLEDPDNNANTVRADYNPLLLAAKIGWRF